MGMTPLVRIEFIKRKAVKLRIEKRRKGQNNNVWERFGEVVKEDDNSAGYAYYTADLPLQLMQGWSWSIPGWYTSCCCK